MQKGSPLANHLRQMTLAFGAAFFQLPFALKPSEKTGGFVSTATKTTTPLSIVDVLSLIRAAV